MRKRFLRIYYAREIDLALQKVAEIATQFRAALGEIHANEKIPEIALVKKSHAESQRVLAQVIEIAKVICGSDINFRDPFLSDVTEVVRIASRTPPKMPSPEKITLPFSSMGILGIETQHQDAVVTTAAVRVGGITLRIEGKACRCHHFPIFDMLISRPPCTIFR